MFQIYPNLVLASQSPRRSAILKQIGIPFQTAASSFEERVPTHLKFSSRTLIPKFFAEQKALSLSYSMKNYLILGFDTVIIFQDSILGKPKNNADAYHMLQTLNGQSHQVVTGVSLCKNGTVLQSGFESTKVTFRANSLALLQKYSNSAEPLDKAGSYAIQGGGAIFIKKINGCYYNVVGLPINLTLTFLKPYTK